LKSAKQEARKASQLDATPPEQFPKMRSTVLGTAKTNLRRERRLPDNVGKHSKKIDTALPGKHTRELYDTRTWMEATILAQLRTGMSRLNESLSSESRQCPQTNARADKQQRRWSTFSSDARNGQHNAPRSFIAQTRKDTMSLSTLEGKQRPMDQMEARHESSPSYDTIRQGNGPTGQYVIPEQGPKRQPPT
jgi:hypothetical protein